MHGVAEYERKHILPFLLLVCGKLTNWDLFLDMLPLDYQVDLTRVRCVPLLSLFYYGIDLGSEFP